MQVMEMPRPDGELLAAQPDIVRAARALHVDRVTAEVVPAFRDAGIPSILLKGPSIARWLYPTGGRGYGDTDLLVPTAMFRAAEEALERLGFVQLLDGWADAERPSHDAERTYLRTTGRVPGCVDLHQSLPHLPVSGDAVWQAFAGRTRPLTVAGVEVDVLDTPALALHVVLHAVQHGNAHHTSEDLRRALGVLSLDEWGEVAGLAAELDLTGELTLGLHLDPGGTLVADALGLGRPAVDASPWWISFAPRGAGSLAALGERKWHARLRWARWTLLPSPAKLRYVAGVRPGRPRALAAAYGRWWWGLARSLGPALRHAGARRRRLLAGSVDERQGAQLGHEGGHIGAGPLGVDPEAVDEHRGEL
jgi:hypothetical protein